MKKLIFTLTTLVLCLTLMGGISALAKDVYPSGMTMVDFESYDNGAAMAADTDTWAFTNLDATGITIVEENGNKYATITGPTNAAKTEARADLKIRNVSYTYDADGKLTSDIGFVYFTFEACGWDNGTANDQVTFAPRNGAVMTTPIYTKVNADAGKNRLMCSGTNLSSKAASIYFSNENQPNHFYKVDIIYDLNEKLCYVYVDGHLWSKFSESKLANGTTKNFDVFRISESVSAAGNNRSIKVDNIGYKAYSVKKDDNTERTLDDVVNEIFATPELRFVGTRSVYVSGKDRWRTTVRAAAKKNSGIIIVASYDENGKLLEVANLNGKVNSDDQQEMGTFDAETEYLYDLMTDYDTVKEIRAFFFNSESNIVPLDASKAVVAQ